MVKFFLQIHFKLYQYIGFKHKFDCLTKDITSYMYVSIPRKMETFSVFTYLYASKINKILIKLVIEVSNVLILCYTYLATYWSVRIQNGSSPQFNNMQSMNITQNLCTKIALEYQIKQSNLYIKATQRNLKYGLYEQFPFIYRLKLYALFINGKNEAVLYRQIFAIYLTSYKLLQISLV